MVHDNTNFSEFLKIHMHSALLMELQAPMENCHGVDVDQEQNNTIIPIGKSGYIYTVIYGIPSEGI
jgi:hypothetical protein